MTAQDRPFVALTGKGLCTLDRKCLLKAGHEGEHWPKEDK